MLAQWPWRVQEKKRRRKLSMNTVRIELVKIGNDQVALKISGVFMC